MFDFEPIFEFSRHYCVAICSLLVPANLAATVTTLYLAVGGRSRASMRWSQAIASLFALTLFVHVSTWFIIGIVTPVTFVLFALGTGCLFVNSLAIAYRQEIQEIFRLFSAKLARPLN